MSRTFPACLVALITGFWSLSLPAQEANGTLSFDVKPFASEGQLVVSLVNKRFIRFDLPNMTRYGESRTLELPPGSYRVSCVGFVPEGGFSVDKALRKGAYFNLYVPQLFVKIIEEGAVKNEAVINYRTAASIAWDDYDGPLKFTVEPEAPAPSP